MFSLSHWGMFDIDEWELESYHHFLWYLNLDPQYQLRE
jgi:hypothetical protein